MAESFGVDAERYDRTRPPYPDTLIERIVSHSPGLDVLDVGCGTGIEARQFRAAGRRVLGSPFPAPPSGSSAELYQPILDNAADGIRRVPGFGAPEQWRFDWERSYTRDEWLDQLPTSGALTQLPPDSLAELQDAVGVAIDAMGGSFTMPYSTVAVTAVRTSTV
ncbi:class I SAM-dependent methyltransferase [Rhodococcus jostii]|uniref:Methyltransferase n=1 Tax=Rhodococcus jostii TaxID=132919 RepID=A0A1H5CWU9_RHOJO|nr:class I SAM-dependent methyltransferase [Rhodococcus jostii]SED70964.1 hypothetical protein SAMN04490220_5285 [Rhodococcus jostii]